MTNLYFFLCVMNSRVAGIEVSVSWIDRIRKHMGLSRKKLQLVSNQRNTPAVQLLRYSYCRLAINFPLPRVVFLDESNFDCGVLARKYGVSRGLRCENRVHRVSASRWSLISVMGLQGVNYFETLDTTRTGVDGQRFSLFLTRLSAVLPRDTIIVMDNAPIHTEAHTRQVIARIPQTVVFQSPYSPDLNPIELLFGLVKTFIKRFERSQNSIPRCIANVFRLYVQEHHCMSFVNHCLRRWRFIAQTGDAR